MEAFIGICSALVLVMTRANGGGSTLPSTGGFEAGGIVVVVKVKARKMKEKGLDGPGACV
jgi:hypothetical protein